MFYSNIVLFSFHSKPKRSDLRLIYRNPPYSTAICAIPYLL